MNPGWISFPPSEVAYPLSTDTVLLADFCTPGARDRICDLGAGVGTLSLLLAARLPQCLFTGFELQEDAAANAANVIAYNDMSDRVNVRQGDIRQIKSLCAPGCFDTVVSNPPYFPAQSGKHAEGRRDICRSETYCSLTELCDAAAYLLKYGGGFSLVHRPERLAELMVSLSSRHLEPKRLRFVKKQDDAAPSLVLLTAKKGGKSGLTILPDLVLTNADGSESAEYQRIYHTGGIDNVR